MAQNTPSTPIAANPSFLSLQNARFANNEFQNIDEGSFRATFADVDKYFVQGDKLTTNMVRGSVFRVPTIVYVNDVPSIDTSLIPPRFRILGMDALATNGTDATTAAAGTRAAPMSFRLIADSTGTVDALVDENPNTSTTIKCRWVRTSGTDAEKMPTFPDLILEDHNYKKGDVFKYTFASGATRLFEWRADGTSFQHPIPTGLDTDVYYAPYSPLSAPQHEQNTDLGTTQGEFRLRLNSYFQDHGLGATVLIFGGVQGGAEMAVRYRFQNVDDTEAAAYEYCFGYTGTASDVWQSHVSKAYVDAGLNTRFNFRGAWAAATTYAQWDAVSFNGATYYRPGAAFTSGSAFDATNWVGFGAGLYTAIDYQNELLPGSNYLTPGITAGSYALSGVGGKSYVLNGHTIELRDTNALPATSQFFGRVFAFRAVGTTASLLRFAAAGLGSIDGAQTLPLRPGEWVVLKSDFAAGGYAVVQRGTTSAATPDTLAYAAALALDFAATPVRTLALTGNVLFTTTNRTSGGEKVLRILGDSTARTLSFPSGWAWLNSAAPTSLAAGKTAILSLTCFGTSESDVVAAYSAQA
jgi:hypothetical protein